MIGEFSLLAILVGAMIWFLKHTTKHQAKREDKLDEERIEKEKNRDEERKEEMLFIRKLVTNDIKELHQDTVKNAELNKESLLVQKDILKSQEDILKSQVRIVTLIGNVDGKMNGRK